MSFKKTIFIVHNYSKESLSNMSFSLAHYLSNLGHLVVFISFRPYLASKKVITQNGGGSIIIMSWPTENRPTSIKDLYWYCKLHLYYRPDVVVGHFVGSNISIFASKFLSFGKTFTIEYYHTLSTQILVDLKKLTLFNKFQIIRKKYFYKYLCDILICASEMSKLDLLNTYGLTKSYVIFYPLEDRYVTNKWLNETDIVISYLGRLDNSKGIMELIKSFNKYVQDNSKTRISLQLAGSGSLLSEIKDLIKFNDKIQFVGRLNYVNIDTYLRDSHFVIIPSKFDAFNLVGIESMMNETPIIISTKTGLSSYLDDEIDCFKINPTENNIYTIFEKVEILELSLLLQMGKAARKKYLKLFSFDNYYQEILKFLR